MVKFLSIYGNMINNSGKNINNTASGYNVRVTPKTKELLDSIQSQISNTTGSNKPLSAIVGDLVYDKAVELGVNG